MTEMVSVGYHRVSDNSGNYAVLPVGEVDDHVNACKGDPDIDQIWTRSPGGEVSYMWFRSGRVEFTLKHERLSYAFIYNPSRNELYSASTDEWFRSINSLDFVRWTDEKSMIEWTRANLALIALGRGEMRSSDDERGAACIANEMPDYMPCSWCYKGPFTLNKNDYPDRKVVSAFVTKCSDPTAAYNLACGHTAIDL